MIKVLRAFKRMLNCNSGCRKSCKRHGRCPWFLDRESVLIFLSQAGIGTMLVSKGFLGPVYLLLPTNVGLPVVQLATEHLLAYPSLKSSVMSRQYGEKCLP